MAASDARPVCRKGVAWRLYFSLRTSTGALYTPWAAQDSEVSLDGEEFADCTNEAVEIGTSGMGYLDLTSSETNADAVSLKITTTGGLPFTITFFPEEAGDFRADITHFGGTAGTFSGGRPEIIIQDGGITAPKVAAMALNGKGDWGTESDLGGLIEAVGESGSGLTEVTTQVAAALALAHGAGSWATATGFSTLTASDVRSAVGLATNNLDTQLGLLATSSALAALVTTVGVAGAGLTEAGGTGDQFTALPRVGATLRYTQVASNSGSKTADVSIGAAS